MLCLNLSFSLRSFIACSCLFISCMTVKGQLDQDSVVKILLAQGKIRLVNPSASTQKSTITPLSISGGTGSLGVADVTVPPVIMPAPNSAMLTRMVSEDVDLYTGRLNVNIPLYTLKGVQLELPISLQANVNAHKVNEYASSVGMGWHLNAGGMITRVMKSLPDEFTGTVNSTHYNITGHGYIRLKQEQNTDISLFESGAYDVGKQREIIERGNWNVSANLPARAYDLQPDEFYFNFGRYSGKFVFDQDGQIHVISRNNLTITATYTVRENNNRISGFTVLTDDGYRYTFGGYAQNAVEETRLNTKSKSIRYHYAALMVDGVFMVDPATGQYMYERYPYVFSMVNPPGTIADNSFDHSSNKEEKSLFYYPSTWYLVNITSPLNEQINFNYADNGTISYLSDRSFSASTINLDEVMVDQRFRTCYFFSEVEPVRSTGWWKYHYPSPHIFTYSESTIDIRSKKLNSITTTQGHSVNFNYATARLDFPADKSLDLISVKNSEGRIIKEFHLNYQNRYSPEAAEKYKFCYNGVFYEDKPGGGVNEVYRYKSDERVFDVPVYCRYRMFLESIQESGEGVQLPPYRFEYESAALPLLTSTEQDKYGFPNSNPSRHPFTDVSYRYRVDGINKKVPITYEHPILYFIARNDGTNSSWPTPAHQGNKHYTLEKMKAGVLKKITYPTGGYKEFELEFNGTEEFWNGLRPKFVREYTAGDALPVTKEYSYGVYQVTDGVALKYEMPENIAPSGYLDKRVFFSSSRLNPQNPTKGASGGYDYAEIKQEGAGKHRIEFTHATMQGFEDIGNGTKIISSLLSPNTQDLGGGISPFPANDSYDWKRGVIVAEHFFDEQSRPVKSINYEYDFTSLNTNPVVIPGLSVTKARLDFGTGNWNCFLYGKTNIYSNWLTTAKMKETIYAKDGINKLEKREEYSYRKKILDDKEFVFLDNTSLYRPDKNDYLVTKNKYCFDYTIGSTPDSWLQGILNLQVAKMWNTTIEQYQYVQEPDGSNKRKISGTLNKYKTNSPIIAQTFTYTPAGSLGEFNESTSSGNLFVYDATYKPFVSFTRNLEYGQVSERYQESNVVESFLWDYQSTYPVAKVVNASVDDIAYTSFETTETGGWTIVPGGTILSTGGVTGQRSFSGKLRRTINRSDRYTVTAWCDRSGTQTLDGSQGKILTVVGNWALKQWEFDVTAPKQVELTANKIDEIRLFPYRASMTTYTYQPLVGMISQSDPNNRISYYEYDGLQRLSLVKDEEGNIVKTYEYNYQDQGTEPAWVSTMEKRCEPCPWNENYTTSVQQVKQIDKNPRSSTYNQIRWFSIGENGSCVINADWVAYGTPTCVLNSSGQSTGVQRITQKDMNPCSETYETTRFVDEMNYVACPSMLPNWVATEELRCKPCPANNLYQSNVQQKKWVDMNPSSATYQQIEWRDNGSTCQVAADWQPTGTPARCQVDQLGQKTGYQEKEHKDLNPCSSTYNTLKWIVTGETSDCMPVYMAIGYENFFDDYYYSYADIVVRFYRDPEMTIPVSVSNLPVKLHSWEHDDCGMDDIFSTETFYCDGESTYLLLGAIIFYQYPGSYCLGYIDYYVSF